MSVRLSTKRKVIALCALMMAVFCFFGVYSPSAKADSIAVRVLLSVGDTDTLSMKVSGTYVISETGTSFKNGTMTLSADGKNVTAVHSSAGEIYTGKTITIQRETQDVSAGTMQFTVNGTSRKYLGDFKVTASGGKLIVVNTVPLDYYLYGVVGYEMSNTWNVEALKAQSIAAKNYVISKLSSSGSYDVKDNATDQVYKGYSANFKNVIAAVDGTSQMALYMDGSIVPCYYSASNGGYTKLPSSNWGPTVFDAVYTEGTDPFDVKNASSRCEKLYIPQNLARRSFSSSDLYTFFFQKMNEAVEKEGALSKGSVLDSFIEISSILSVNDQGISSLDGEHTKFIVSVRVKTNSEDASVPQPTPSPAPSPVPSPIPSATMESVVVEDSGVVVIDGETEETEKPSAEGDQKQSAREGQVDTVNSGKEETLVFTVLFSEMEAAGLFQDTSLRIYYAMPADGGWTLYHGRFGHGVGMSQRGAQQMAKEGWTYEQILSFYYPGARLETLAYDIPKTSVVASDKQDYSEKAQEDTVIVDIPENSGESENQDIITVDGGSSEETEEAEQTETDKSSGNGTVIKSSTLYSGASETAPAVEQVEIGAELQASRLTGDWYLVRDLTTNKVGYIYSSNLKVTGDKALATAVVNASSVNFRSGPGTDYESMGRLDKKDKVQVLSKADDWYRIMTMDGQEGYVSAQYLTLTGAAEKKNSSSDNTSKSVETGEASSPISIKIAERKEQTVVPTEFLAFGKTNADNIPLKSGPSAFASNICSLQRDSEFGIYKKTGSWYWVKQVETGQIGYLHVKNLTLCSSGNKGETMQIAVGRINTDAVELRTGPSSQYAGIDTLKTGTLVTILSSNSDWYQVLVSNTGLMGYILANYVDLDIMGKQQGNTGNAGLATVTTGIMYLYEKPEVKKGKTVAAVRRGYTVAVHSVENDWAYVSYNGKSGYCNMKYLMLK